MIQQIIIGCESVKNRPSKYEALAKCWADVGPYVYDAGPASAQHWATPRVCWGLFAGLLILRIYSYSTNFFMCLISTEGFFLYRFYGFENPQYIFTFSQTVFPLSGSPG